MAFPDSTSAGTSGVEIVGLIPAAGHASRLQPLDRSKEMLEIDGRPVIDYLVERMLVGGATRLRVVTRAAKTDVISHCTELGAELVLGQPATVGESLAAAAAGIGQDAIVLLGYPDTLWEPRDGYLRLVESVRTGCDVALGLFRVEASELTRSDVVVLAGEGTITHIDVKPNVPRSNWIWGCAAARADAMAGIAATEWPGSHFDRLRQEGRDISGIQLSDVWLDIGTHEALAYAERRFRGLSSDGAPRSVASS